MPPVFYSPLECWPGQRRLCSNCGLMFAASYEDGGEKAKFCSGRWKFQTLSRRYAPTSPGGRGLPLREDQVEKCINLASKIGRDERCRAVLADDGWALDLMTVRQRVAVVD